MLKIRGECWLLWEHIGGASNRNDIPNLCDRITFNLSQENISKGCWIRVVEYCKCCVAHRRGIGCVCVYILSIAQEYILSSMPEYFWEKETINIYIGTKLSWNAPIKVGQMVTPGIFHSRLAPGRVNPFLYARFFLYFTIKWLIWILIFKYTPLLPRECHF